MASHQKEALRQMVFSDIVQLARTKYHLLQYTHLVNEMLESSDGVDEHALAELMRAFRGVIGTRKMESVRVIDLEPLRQRIDNAENLDYLRRQRAFYQGLAKSEILIRDFLRMEMLPEAYQSLVEYLRKIAGSRLSDVLSLTRGQHYGFAQSRHLIVTEDFLDSLDEMFCQVLGFGLETRPQEIVDICLINAEVLSSTIHLTEEMGDCGPERNKKQ
jgi:hypothetical protein